MDKVYQPEKFEKEIYRKWEESGAFKAEFGEKDQKDKRGNFTILMPPPNANASLHAGHAMYTVDDVLIRWKRMQGYSTVWLPGMDHAGFETQFVYEKNLAKQGKSRLDFDRQTLYQNIFQFVKDNSGMIYEQFKRLGFSADWSRSVFTLDDHVLKQVWETFIRMEKERLIYKDSYIVNFCTRCGTSLAELEVVHEERVDPLYYIKYGPFILATVRPETKFGDTAVAVHPRDKRYKKYIGQEITVEGLIGKFKVKVIADETVDPRFGTGVVKVTPAHDPNDFQMGLRHGLEIKQVIGPDGKLNEKCGIYQGLRVAEARKKVADDLQAAGLMVKIDENYKHSVGLCYKCKRVLEPTVIPNWFIKVESLKKPVVEAVRENKIKFYPTRFKKQILTWLTMMHDWPISRQICWGIRIPVWYQIGKKQKTKNKKQNGDIEVKFIDKNKKLIRGKIGELLKDYSLVEVKNGLQELRAAVGIKYTVSVSAPGEDYLQETDTFDTWFSSGQWPLVTLKQNEFKTRFPTDVIGTLSDILPFWISRMIIFSLYLKKEVPFRDVYLWSMVTDAKGVKMSKSKGNVINPIELVDKYGADALRMTLLYGVAPGSAIPLSEDKVRGMRNFSNKIWNAARYVMSREQRSESRDQEFLDKLNAVIGSVTKNLENYRLGLAAETVYNEFWHWFCDEAIEKNKTGKLSDKAIFHGLITFLKLLHPFVPFVTEAIWEEIKDFRKYPKQMLIASKWPK
ncbi:valine--tRNA ligase [Candidatus Collierbacteria bacterium]|nr:valine--tRNA ligase [Candidatus Collierbacteria bacterium]